MKQEINQILDYLHNRRGYDFSGNRSAMLERRITKRLFATGTKDYTEYYTHLLNHPEELDKLLDVLTINVSSFFRDPLVWEVLAKNIIPNLIEKKRIIKNPSAAFGLLAARLERNHIH